MMRLKGNLFAIVFFILLSLTVFPAVGQEDESPPPRDIGLQETDVKGIVIRDLVVAGTLSNGLFLYDMTVGNGEGRVTAGNLEFAAY